MNPGKLSQKWPIKGNTKASTPNECYPTRNSGRVCDKAAKL